MDTVLVARTWPARRQRPSRAWTLPWAAGTSSRRGAGREGRWRTRADHGTRLLSHASVREVPMPLHAPHGRCHVPCPGTRAPLRRGFSGENANISPRFHCRPENTCNTAQRAAREAGPSVMAAPLPFAMEYTIGGPAVSVYRPLVLCQPNAQATRGASACWGRPAPASATTLRRSHGPRPVARVTAG
jgi:hypothetical protein